MVYITLNGEKIDYEDILSAAQNAQLAMGNETDGSNGHWSNTETIKYTLVGLLAGGQVICFTFIFYFMQSILISFSFYSKRQQVYLNWHQNLDKLGSIWWRGAGDEKGGALRRGDIFSGERIKTIENTIRGKYLGDQDAGNLGNLPTV